MGRGEVSTSEPSDPAGSFSVAYLQGLLDLRHCEHGHILSHRSLRWRHELQLLTGRGRLTALPAWPEVLSKTMVAMVGVMLATGTRRSADWLGTVGAVEVGVLAEVDPDPLSWVWMATGVAMVALGGCIRV